MYPAMVELIGINKVKNDNATLELHFGLVFIDRLERGVVGNRAIAEGEPAGVRDTFAWGPAVDDFRGLKEMFDLIFGEWRILCTERKGSPSGEYDGDEDEARSGQAEWKHAGILRHLRW